MSKTDTRYRCILSGLLGFVSGVEFHALFDGLTHHSEEVLEAHRVWVVSVDSASVGEPLFPVALAVIDVAFPLIGLLNEDSFEGLELLGVEEAILVFVCCVEGILDLLHLSDLLAVVSLPFVDFLCVSGLVLWAPLSEVVLKSVDSPVVDVLNEVCGEGSGCVCFSHRVLI